MSVFEADFGGKIGPGSTEKPDIAAVLFDMGGVLVELGPFDQVLNLPGLDAEEFWARWLASPAVRALESGKSTVDRFAVDLIDELQLSLGPVELIEKFSAVPRGLFPGAVALVGSVRESVVTGLLSNTNAVHWDGLTTRAPALQQLCKRRYLSFELGLTKPDKDIFDHVVADLGVATDQVLFVDDSPANVEGARAAGLHSELARGPAAAAAVLAAYSVTDDG